MLQTQQINHPGSRTPAPSLTPSAQTTSSWMTSVLKFNQGMWKVGQPRSILSQIGATGGISSVKYLLTLCVTPSFGPLFHLKKQHQSPVSLVPFISDFSPVFSTDFHQVKSVSAVFLFSSSQRSFECNRSQSVRWGCRRSSLLPVACAVTMAQPLMLFSLLEEKEREEK